MAKAEKTKEKLLCAARDAFWSKGYSNVSLRDISNVAKVDVALISRYFGGKKGLFEATLEGAFDWPDLLDESAGSPIDVVIEKFSNAATESAEISVVQLILMNGSDPDVGDSIRQGLADGIVEPLCRRMGGEGTAANVALFFAVILGTSVTRKQLGMPGLVGQTTDEFARQLRHMMEAALSFQSKTD